MPDIDDEWVLIDLKTLNVIKQEITTPPPVPPRPSPEVVAKLLSFGKK